MTIKPYQPGFLPVGQFDVLDTDLAEIEGGELVVFDNIDSSVLDKAAPDVFVSDDGYRALLRLATGIDTGPFYFANIGDRRNQSPGFELTSLYATNQPFGQTFDASGKVSIFTQEGFYSVSSTVVDTTTITPQTPIHTRLYVGTDGRLTAAPSVSGAIAGFFIEYRDGDALREQRARRFEIEGTHDEGDSIIVFKTNADGYFNINLMAQMVGQLGQLGTPSDGYYSDGYFAFTPSTTIADAVDQLNEAFGALNSGSATTAIGTPTDGTYLDGFFPFVPSTTVANAVDDINELLLAIAPAQPGVLTGQSLTVSGTTLFSAILPSGLAAAWYSGGDVAGGTITSYIVDGTYLLDSPDQANRFNGGRVTDTSLLGSVFHVLNGVDGYSHDATTGTGTTGTVTVDDISAFNTIWNKINAEIAVTQTAEGRETHAMRHTTLSGTSDTSEFFYDPVNTAPSFSVAPTITENTPVDGYLSGIIHYASGSTFDLAYTAASGIFNRAYHPTEVSRIEVPGSPNTAVNPGSVPAFSDTFPVSGETITLSTSNVASETPSATVRLFKPNGDTTSATDSLNRAVNTFGTASTTTTESFVDEAQRFTDLASTSADWTSSDVLVDGYAQVYISGTGGAVSFPRVSDYPGFVATEQFYQRRFTKVSASSGTIVFGGISVSDIDPYGTGDTNVILRLDSDNLFFDCGLPFGSNNGTGSGDSFANSIGCQVGTSSGSTLDFTFGVNNTATNGNQYRAILIFKNTSDVITSLTTS